MWKEAFFSTLKETVRGHNDVNKWVTQEKPGVYKKMGYQYSELKYDTQTLIIVHSALIQ